MSIVEPLAPHGGGLEGVGPHPRPQPADPENKREILADEKLRAVFGQDKATMFEMNSLLSKHLT